MIQSLSIIMPCFNEQEAIPNVLPRTLQSLNDLKVSGKIKDFELIVVNDKSTDNSVEQIQKFKNVKLVHTNGTGRGYGKALKEGFKVANSEWIGFLDMDNSYRPEDLPLFIEEIDKGQSDFIMGQRSLAEQGMSFTRGIGNWLYVVLSRWFYNSYLSDVCSGYRIFHRRHLGDILNIEEDGLNFSIQLTLEMIGQKNIIAPIPIQYDERLGESKLSVLSDGLAFLRVILTAKLRQARAFKHSRV
jgi:glycosyltransferase involved in cell wall biosynthesis